MKEVEIITDKLPEILFITSYPPVEGISAHYARHLIKELHRNFGHAFKISICSIESKNEQYSYTDEIKYTINTDYPKAFIALAALINKDSNVRIIVIQLEFLENSEADLLLFLEALDKPTVIAFHIASPEPGKQLKEKIQKMTTLATAVVVRSATCFNILLNEYGLPEKKMVVVPGGTKFLSLPDKQLLKEKHRLTGRKVIATFGSLNPEHSIETTLRALPEIIKSNSDIVFLIVGQTQPVLMQQEGYKYRNLLDAMVRDLQLQNHVQYINYHLPFAQLQEYLQLTDIYLLTCTNAEERISSSFSYALNAGCFVVSTPITGAAEALQNNAAIIIDFGASDQLAAAVLYFLNDTKIKTQSNTGQVAATPSTGWEDAAIAHAMLFEKICESSLQIR